MYVTWWCIYGVKDAYEEDVPRSERGVVALCELSELIVMVGLVSVLLCWLGLIEGIRDISRQGYDFLLNALRHGLH